jgi:hypothetical protein
MDYRFNAEEWETLSIEHRIRRCRLMAEEAMKLAQSTSPTVAELYLEIAGNWLKLADEMSRSSG